MAFNYLGLIVYLIITNLGHIISYRILLKSLKISTKEYKDTFRNKIIIKIYKVKPAKYLKIIETLV